MLDPVTLSTIVRLPTTLLLADRIKLPLKREVLEKSMDEGLVAMVVVRTPFR